MNRREEMPQGTTELSRKPYERYQSDVIVDLMQRYDIPYVALNPGASFRGLHDSLINYGGNRPEMLLCQHEETAVQIAHGYARATGRPMGVILHNLVGLLHAQLAVYYAYIDRAPVFIIGATGPMHEGKRRPHIDWSHTALVQGEAVRNYTKWDYQPTAIEGVPESFMRAYAAMMTEPKGPIYLCYDAWLQEEKLTAEVAMPPADMALMPSPMAADPATLEKIVDKLLKAEHPVILTQFVGRHPDGFANLTELAETLGVGVWDVNDSLCFPNRHPLSVSMDRQAFRKADAILGLAYDEARDRLYGADGLHDRLVIYDAANNAFLPSIVAGRDLRAISQTPDDRHLLLAAGGQIVVIDLVTSTMRSHRHADFNVGAIAAAVEQLPVDDPGELPDGVRPRAWLGPLPSEVAPR